MATLEMVHIFISGRVQGVGFRYHTRRAGMRFGLTGWVRNLNDGRVEVFAEGPLERIEELVRWCARGPATAQVYHLELAERKTIGISSLSDFEIR